jgi:hypothetical protein
MPAANRGGAADRRLFHDNEAGALEWRKSHSAKVLDQGRPCTIASPAVPSSCGAFFGSEGARTPWFIAARAALELAGPGPLKA